MKKRVLSAFTALALCLTLLPAPAWAAEADTHTHAGTDDPVSTVDTGTAVQTSEETVENPVAEVAIDDGTPTQYATLTEAITAAQGSNGSTVKLLSDITLPKANDGISVSEGSFTLDLNNKTIQGEIFNQLLDVNGAAKLTIKNGSLVNTFANGNSAAIGSTLLALNISGGTVALENVNLTSGIVQSENYGHNPALYITGGSLTVTGSTFTGQVMVDCTQPDKRPVLSITDATLNNGIFYGVMGVQGMDTAGLKAIFTDGSMLFDQNSKYIDLTKTDYWPSEGAGAVFFYPEKCIVKPHTHNIVNGQCECGAQFAASVAQNGAVTYYEDFATAVKAWLANGGTLKLYGDYTATDGTWSIGSGSHTINLNGHRMLVQNDGAFKPTNNMHLTVTDDTERGQIDNILLDGSQGGSFTLESGYVGNLEMTGGAVVALKGGSVDELDVEKSSANTNLSIQGGRLGKLNIKDWADGMHVSATSGSLGAYNLPSGKILADVLDHQYYATGTSLDRQVDTAQKWEQFVIKQAPYDFGSTSKAADVPINGSIPFRVDSPSENVGVYEVKWYRRTDNGAVHMTENKVAGVNVGDTLDVFCVITGMDTPGGEMKWQVAVKGYTLQTLPPSLESAEIKFADGWQERTFWPDPGNHSVGKTVISSDLGAYTVRLNDETLKEGTDYTVSGNVATGVGTYNLTIKGVSPHYSGTKTVQWKVVPHKLKGLWVTSCSKQYDGTVALPDEAVSERFESANNYGQITLQKGTDYVVTDARFDTPDASNENKDYRYTVELKNPNYVFKDGTKVQTWVYGVDVNAPIKITKADAPTARESALEVINNHADTYTVDLSALLPKLESPKEYGNVTYKLGTVSINGDYYEAGTAKIEGSKLILPIQAVETSTESSIGTVTVKVTSGNIVDFDLTINVNATNKIVPTGTPTLSKTTLAWGEQLSTISLSGAMTDPADNTKTVTGKFAWTNSATTPDSMSDFAAEWKFTPENTDVYAEITGTVKLTVTKATPTGAPTYTKITTTGKTLKDANLTVGTIQPEGEIKWELGDKTVVAANTAYKWVFIPNDDAHYNELTGLITPYSVSSSTGGSSSGSSGKTEIVTKPDGTKVETTTKPDGTTVKTETKKDGSVTKTETKKDGSSVTENKAADGSTGTVKIDKNGQTTAEAKISDKAVSDAKKSGEAVKIPAEVTPGEDSKSAPAVKIDLPGNSGETKIEIPVKGAASGTVAVIVKPDGTEEIVKDSLPVKDGIQLTVDGDMTVKIMDNAKDFTDTKGHWAQDSIDFVSARGLVNGTGESTFSPNAPTTRAQLWTILARQAGADLTGGASWYEKAQAWAKERGISDGSDPNGAITRAQMVTMLYRAAGSPEVSITTTFTDAPADSYYAKAVAWAVENGITTGVGGGRFDPNSTCTRGQIATFLRRAVAE